MPSLGEEVERLDAGDFVGVLEAFEIADLGRGIATDVNDAPWSKINELDEELGAAPFSRRVDDDGGAGGGKGDVREEIRSVSLDKAAVLDPVAIGIALRPIDRRLADLDADGFGEGRGGGETKT